MEGSPSSEVQARWKAAMEAMHEGNHHIFVNKLGDAEVSSYPLLVMVMKPPHCTRTGSVSERHGSARRYPLVHNSNDVTAIPCVNRWFAGGRARSQRILRAAVRAGIRHQGPPSPLNSALTHV